MSNNPAPDINREKVIIHTSVVGILTNVFLAAFKAAVGMLSNSIAVVLDAVNNLSDAMSSIITIVGAKLSAKLPDKKHPLGYGRIEYLTAMIISGIVLFAGLTSAVESVKKIIHPEKPDYSLLSLLIIAVAVVIKVFLGGYVIARGKKVYSASLIASGTDAMNDAILSGSVLACAVIFKLTGLSLEPFVGLVISVFGSYTGRPGGQDAHRQDHRHTGLRSPGVWGLRPDPAQLRPGPKPGLRPSGAGGHHDRAGG